MASIVQRFRSAVAAFRTQPAPMRSGLRRFDGAKIDRLTASWMATGTAIDQELRGQLDALRARSRDLFKNNEYAAKFGRMFRNGVVGPEGFTLQARARDPNGKLDAAANTAIETVFWNWQAPEHCDVRGLSSFVDITRSVALALARDGEFLVRLVRGRGDFGFQLQVLDVDRLDTRLNREASQGVNAIIMGIEVDSYRRPVAYHLWTSPPTLQGQAGRERERVLARDVLHRFIPIEDEQTRGVPMLHAAMRRLNDLGGYREAAVIAARLGASKMGFFISSDGQPHEGEETASGDFVTEATPGSFDILPTGYDFKEYNPAYPHEQFDAFCKAALRGIASATGVAYPSLANDLEGVNFSSIRAGLIEERDEWMGLQNFVITAFLAPVFKEWLDQAMIRELIRLPSGAALPIAKREKFLAHSWLGRRWQWVDPMKDIQASVIAIANGLASPQQIAAQSGRDIEEILDDLATFQQMLTAKGITLPGGSGKPTAKATADDDVNE
jgi:lambda family phage portal protein